MGDPTLCLPRLPEFEPAAEAAGLSGELWAYVFERCIRQGARWHRILPREDSIYISINMSSQQLFHHDLVQNLRLIIGRETLPKGALRLEIAETLINSNPEQAIEIMDWLKPSMSALRSMNSASASPRCPVGTGCPSTPSRSTARL